MNRKRGFMLSSIVAMVVIIISFISWQLVRFNQEQETFFQTEQLLKSLNNFKESTNNN
ncbi:hypothetical protein [Culicoidibacter larvae]|uniref:hypothetical protein n=1 Tax=Culicoidibacter larvae TaxID=2579976 RepID=UPI001485962A|nr:hypothetical protein [Culicoidibacter larvae]